MKLKMCYIKYFFFLVNTHLNLQSPCKKDNKGIPSHSPNLVKYNKKIRLIVRVTRECCLLFFKSNSKTDPSLSIRTELNTTISSYSIYVTLLLTQSLYFQFPLSHSNNK